MIRLAVVGIGGYGWDLIGGIQAAGECRLVAAADNRLGELSDRAGELADRGVELFDDAPTMYRKLAGKCDAVYIATGIASHAALTISAFEGGFHVHLEKPPAVTVQEIDAMLSAQQRTGLMCLVGFHQIHNRSTRFLKQRAVAGRLGPVRTIVCRASWPRPDSYYARNDWAGQLKDRRGQWVLDGPASNALAHQINNMLYVISPGAGQYAVPTAVRAELYAAGNVQSHNTAAIEIHCGRDTRAYWLGSHCAGQAYGPMIDIEGANARVAWRPEGTVDIAYADGSRESCEGDDSRRGMIANFLDAVEGDDESILRCTLAQTRAFVLALDGAHESSGRVHRIDGPAVRTVAETTKDGGADERTVVPGLDDLITRAARAGGLFSDLDDAPTWAVPSEAYDLGEYRSFPQRFACE